MALKKVEFSRGMSPAGSNDLEVSSGGVGLAVAALDV